MSISNEIERLQQAKTDIKTAITNKGTTVPDTALISDFDTYVSNIATDTTATQAQIFNGKTAYINGAKVTGTGLATATTATESTILSGYKAYNNSGALITGTKGIKTGTVTATKATSLTISGLGFTPTYIMITLETSVNTYDSTRYVFCISNGGGTVWGCYSPYTSHSAAYYNHYCVSGGATISTASGSVTITTSNSSYFYAGTYRYIAWN